MGERKGEYRILVGKSDGKKLLGRPRRRRKDNIKMNLLGADLIKLAWHRDRWWLLVNAVMNIWVP